MEPRGDEAVSPVPDPSIAAEQVSEVEGSGEGAVAKIDRDLSEDDWYQLLDDLVGQGILNWADIANVALGELNPPQVGTAIASRKSFQVHYPFRRTWRAVRAWFYEQSGVCDVCGTRVQLEGEHVVPRAELGDDADVLTNMQLLCKRCNAVKRPSHKNAGVTFLTAQTALMFLLLTRRPRTYQEFKALCREYGLTMADIRFQEAWALAIWLWREGRYDLDEQDPWLLEALAEPWIAEEQARGEETGGPSDLPPLGDGVA